MTRDRRLLISIGLFVFSFVALAVQSVIVSQYIYSSIMDDNWESFALTYGVKVPANGRDAYCLDYCAPELPFIAGWLGIGAFLCGLVSITYIWLKPRS